MSRAIAPSRTGSKAEESSSLPLLSVVRMLWNRRKLAIATWLAGSAITVAVVQSLPSVYQAHAVVLVDSQKIPVDFVSPTVGGDVPDRLALITQSIMTSARLLSIIKSYHLYQNRHTDLTEEDLLSRMRSDISVEFEKSWTGDRMHAFELAYEGRDANTAAGVANRLAGLYVAENARAREHQAENTVVFLNRQLQDAKASLDEQEQKIALFKQQHSGSLPEQQNPLLATLSSLSVQLEGIQQSIDQTESNKSLLESALSAAESADATVRANMRGLAGSGAAPRLKSDVLKEQLRELLLTYTQDFPEVMAVKQQLAEAEREERGEEPVTDGGAASAPHAWRSPATRDASGFTSPEVLQSRERIATLRAQIVASKRQLESFDKERQQVVGEINDCKAKINRLPLVEQSMASLKRNYEESATYYNSLLQKQLAAGVASDMERSQQSEQFTIIDPARPPEKPIKPNRPLLIAGGAIGSLVLGLVLALGLEWRNRKFLGEWELPAGTVVLGRVPVLDGAQFSTGPNQT